MDQQYDDIDAHSLRHRVLECARDFKASWIEMGRFLYTVYKDKHYRTWVFQEFETYCLKEIGVKTQTAQKLLRSYNFLEKEEPKYVEKDSYEGEDAPRVPNYESVDVLRLAKNNKLPEEDYTELRQKVLEEGKPVQAVRKSYREMMDAQKSESSEEIESRKKVATFRRYLTNLKTLKETFMSGDYIPKTKLAEMGRLVEQLENIVTEAMD